MLDRLLNSLKSAPVINIAGYDYFIHPLTDGIPRVDPLLLSETVEALLQVGRFDCDLILAPEAMGIPLAVALSLRLGIPFSVVRKRCYGLPGEVRLDQSTGYSKGCLYVNDIRAGDRVVIVDDVLSSGGTMRPLIRALRSVGAEVTEVLVVVEKGDRGGSLAQELGVTIRSLVKVEIREGRVAVVGGVT
jgi:adenine phosphoribosyltransferase